MSFKDDVISFDLPEIPCHNYNEFFIQCKKACMRDFFERVHRRTGSRYCQLHYRGKCYRQADGEEIRNQQEYGTCGSNNIERLKSKVVWAIE